jgi:hypothetical protein
MKIKVIHYPEGIGHAYLYAWIDENSTETPFKIDGKEVRSIKFSSTNSVSAKYTSISLDDDNYVILNSNVSFNEFCTRSSKLVTNPSSLEHVNGNCADLTLEALCLAGIHIEYDDCTTRWKPMFETPWGRIKIYTAITTPPDLIDHIKAYKSNLLAANSTYSQYEFHKKELRQYLQNQSNNTLTTPLVAEIVNQLETRKYAHPEHLDFYADVLTQTLVLLRGTSSTQQKSNYLQLAGFFKHRPKYPAKRDFLLQLFSWLAFCTATLSIINDCVQNPKERNHSNTALFNIVMCMMPGVAALVVYACKAKPIEPEETKLSNAMCQLAYR